MLTPSRTTGRRDARAPTSFGFTLVELLVVIAIIGVLVGLLLPAVQTARESGRRTQCTGNLKQMGLAIANFESIRKVFPCGRVARDPTCYSWAFALLPWLEEQQTFDAWVPGVPVYDDRNARAMRTPVAVYYCPSRRGPAADRNFDNNDRTPPVTAAAAGGDYAANAGTWYMYASDPGCDPQKAGPIHTFSKVRAAQVTDGLSKTLAIGDRHIPPADPSWGEMAQHHQGDTAFFAGDTPTTIFRDTYRGLVASLDDRSTRKFGSRHPGATSFVFLDGHVEPIDNQTPSDVLLRQSVIGDGPDPIDAGDDGT